MKDYDQSKPIASLWAFLCDPSGVRNTTLAPITHTFQTAPAGRRHNSPRHRRGYRVCRCYKMGVIQRKGVSNNHFNRREEIWISAGTSSAAN